MILSFDNIIKFLKVKYPEQKILVLGDDQNFFDFVGELKKYCIVLNDEKFLQSDSVRIVVNFGKNVQSKKPMLYFAKNINDFLKNGGNICADCFDFNKKTFLMLLAQIVNYNFEYKCKKILFNETDDKVFFDDKILFLLKNLDTNYFECLEFLHSLKEQNFFNTSCDFVGIVNNILNYKLVFAFLKEQPFVKVFNQKSISNSCEIFYTYMFLNLHINELCYKLCETRQKLIDETIIFGKICKSIFLKYKNLCVDFGYNQIKKIENKVLIKNFFKEKLNDDFSMVKIMNELGLI